MALFRTHLSVGSAVALFFAGALFFTALLTDPLLLGILFIVTVVMSFAPDVDSDRSIPFHLIYGAIAIGVTGYSVALTLTYTSASPVLLIGIPSVTFLVMWFVIGWFFKSYTRHRGMFHSIPAACCAALATYLAADALLAEPLAGDIRVATLFAAGAGLGYLTHLILDELYAAVTLDGGLFTPKRSLGTALKFASSSRWRTLSFYVVLSVLVYLVLYAQ